MHPKSSRRMSLVSSRFSSGGGAIHFYEELLLQSRNTVGQSDIPCRIDPEWLLNLKIDEYVNDISHWPKPNLFREIYCGHCLRVYGRGLRRMFFLKKSWSFLIFNFNLFINFFLASVIFLVLQNSSDMPSQYVPGYFNRFELYLCNLRETRSLHRSLQSWECGEGIYSRWGMCMTLFLAKKLLTSHDGKLLVS